MTRLLQKAFEKASMLPDVEQNAMARWLLEEIESEKKWEQIFASSEDILDHLANEAIEEHRHNKTKPLDIDIL